MASKIAPKGALVVDGEGQILSVSLLQSPPRGAGKKLLSGKSRCVVRRFSYAVPRQNGISSRSPNQGVYLFRFGVNSTRPRSACVRWWKVEMRSRPNRDTTTSG